MTRFSNSGQNMVLSTCFEVSWDTFLVKPNAFFLLTFLLDNKKTKIGGSHLFDLYSKTHRTRTSALFFFNCFKCTFILFLLFFCLSFFFVTFSFPFPLTSSPKTIRKNILELPDASLAYMDGLQAAFGIIFGEQKFVWFYYLFFFLFVKLYSFFVNL